MKTKRVKWYLLFYEDKQQEFINCNFADRFSFINCSMSVKLDMYHKKPRCHSISREGERKMTNLFSWYRMGDVFDVKVKDKDQLIKYKLVLIKLIINLIINYPQWAFTLTHKRIFNLCERMMCASSQEKGLQISCRNALWKWCVHACSFKDSKKWERDPWYQSMHVFNVFEQLEHANVSSLNNMIINVWSEVKQS